MLSDEIQLGFALEAFGIAHSMGAGWAVAKLACLRLAGITSMNDLEIGCKEQTVNLDLELFGVPPEEQFSDTIVTLLQSFLPGPKGFRCFRLAQMAAEKVKKGTADTEYVHRPESGKLGDETWHTPVGDDWTIHVDCAGFVRNCLKHVTKDPFKMALSDRDFMRAKDFYRFFDAIPYTVLDPEPVPETETKMQWRIVKDLRLVIPGDVITYRPRGHAAGGAAFTTNDRKDLTRVLRAARTAQLWRDHEGGSWRQFTTRNLAKDPTVQQWVEAVKAKLHAVGIKTVKDLYTNLEHLNDLLRAANHQTMFQDTLALMKEICETRAQNTGHIVFAAGLAVHMGDGEYRIRVIHSTKYGKVDPQSGEVTTGVQEHYRRFRLVELEDGTTKWTRAMKAAKPLMPAAATTNACEADLGKNSTNNDDVCPLNAAVSDDEDNLLDDMEDEEGEDPPIQEEAAEPEVMDELAGLAEVDVIAARMCF